MGAKAEVPSKAYSGEAVGFGWLDGFHKGGVAAALPCLHCSIQAVLNLGQAGDAASGTYPWGPVR